MLSSGLPRRAEYAGIETQPGYATLLAQSREFGAKCRAAGLSSRLYGAKWVTDPFLQWSRRWEYVYVLQRLEAWWREHPDARDVVDAGSGFTFFPFHLKHANPALRLTCFDADPTVGRAIDEARAIVGSAPDFRLEDLEKLDQPSESLDAVYSVSVIEHTSHPARVVDEIHRVLRPGGLFVCTFDISFEPKSPMSAERVEALIDRLNEHFDPELGWNEVRIGAQLALHEQDWVTTQWIAGTAAETLPWKRPVLVWLYDALRGRFRRRLIRPITFYCGAFVRK